MAELAHPIAHQFDEPAQQHESATLGMWIFLVTEVMFFGGMFTAYVVYRSLFPDAFGHLAVGVGLHQHAEIAFRPVWNGHLQFGVVTGFGRQDAVMSKFTQRLVLSRNLVVAGEK